MTVVVADEQRGEQLPLIVVPSANCESEFSASCSNYARILSPATPVGKMDQLSSRGGLWVSVPCDRMNRRGFTEFLYDCQFGGLPAGELDEFKNYL